ncbi:MAG: adenine deaminase [Bacteroidetes bacterium]|nr:MAG: adenine deaminase [Bacteroidota bacterium]
MVLSGNIVDVVGKRIYQGELHIQNGVIADIKEVNTDEQHYLIPGFVDAHIHVESSMLIPSEFARLAVVHGTVGTVSDPHEIANVVGIEGVRYMIDNGKKVPFKFNFGAPSCVPATDFETAGAAIDADQIKELMSWKDIRYLSEIMNFPGVLAKDEQVLLKIKAAQDAGKVVDGHAPGLMGEDARKYIEAGISTDHECFTKEEALDKLKYGMKIIIREGSAAKNFEALIELMEDHSDKIMFCSDDKHPNELAVGHINLLAQRAVAKGFDPITVLRSCSYNPVKHYSLDIGLLQKGDFADVVVVKDLKDFGVNETYIDGELVAQNGSTLIESVSERTINQFNCEPIEETAIEVNAEGGTIKVIEAFDGQLITNAGEATAKSVDGKIVSDTEEDVLKMVVVNRYGKAQPAIAFVKNFGLKKGAIASTVAHDCHNIIAVGVDDQDIITAINLLIRCKGGVSLVSDSEQSVLELPVGGLMSNIDGYKIADEYEALDNKSKELGSQLSAPYMTLSFMALLVIPKLKLSDRGLFDGETFQFTSVFV